MLRRPARPALVPRRRWRGGEVRVPATGGALQDAIAGADPGDVLILSPGRHDGPVTLSQPITLDGRGKAVIDGGGSGSVITVTGPDITVRGLEIIGSGDDHQTIDSGVQLTKTARRAWSRTTASSAISTASTSTAPMTASCAATPSSGARTRRMNARGNGVYVWNAPGRR